MINTKRMIIVKKPPNPTPSNEIECHYCKAVLQWEMSDIFRYVSNNGFVYTIGCPFCYMRLTVKNTGYFEWKEYEEFQEIKDLHFYAKYSYNFINDIE